MVIKTQFFTRGFNMKKQIIPLLLLTTIFCFAEYKPVQSSCMWHDRIVSSLAINPESGLLVSGSEDQTVKMWDLDTGNQIWKSDEHEKPVTGVLFPGSNRVVSVSREGRVVVLDSTTGEVIKRFETGDRINAIAGDDSALFTATREGVVKSWNLVNQSFKEVAVFDNPVTALAFSRESSMLAAGDAKGNCLVLDITSGRQLGRFKPVSRDITALGFSPGAKALAVGSEDKIIIVYNTRDWKKLMEKSGFDDITGFSYSKSGNYMAVGTNTRWFIVFDTRTWQRRAYDSYCYRVYSIVFSNDEKTLYCGGRNRITMLDLEMGDLFRNLEQAGGTGNYPTLHMQSGHSDSILAAAISPDGNYLATGGKDLTVKIWNLRTGHEIRTLYGHAAILEKVAFSPDGRYLATGDQDRVLKIWDPASGKLVRELHGLSQKSRFDFDFQFSKDGRWIAGGAYPTTSLVVWDFRSGDMVTEIDTGEGINSVSISPDGNVVACTWQLGNSVMLYDRRKGTLIHKLKSNSKNLAEVMMSNNGKLVTAVSTGGRIYTWRISDGKLLWDLGGEVYSTFDRFSIQYMEDDSHVVVCGRDTVLHIESSSGNVDGRFKSTRIKNEHTNAALPTPNGERIVTAGSESVIRIWNTADGELLDSMRGTVVPASSTALSPSGKFAIIARDGQLQLWDIDQGRKLRDMKQEDWKGLYRPVFSTDETLIAALHSTVKGTKLLFTTIIFDRKSGEILHKIEGGWGAMLALSPDNGSILTNEGKNLLVIDIASGSRRRIENVDLVKLNFFALSPDGRYIATTGNMFSIKVWDFKSGDFIAGFDNSFGSIHSLVFSNDGRYLFQNGSDGITVCWDMHTKTAAGWFPGMGNAVYAQAISKDNRYLASAGFEGKIAVWDFQEKKPVSILHGHNGPVKSLVFSGYTLFSSSLDGTIREWDIKDGGYLATLVNGATGNFLYFTHDGYWSANRDGGNQVAMVQGLDSWNVDQFAVHFNRPDLIIKRLGVPDETLIEHYYLQYRKRLRKSGSKESRGTVSMHVPTAEILDEKRDGAFVTYTVECRDKKYPLSSYNIFINNVPLFGSYGKRVNGRRRTVTEKVPLSPGSNKIEISCTNSKGVESYRVLSFQDLAVVKDQDLYYIGFGVSTYRDSSLNLAYAHKDAGDIAQLVKKLEGKQFNRVFTHVFMDKEATRETITSARDLLEKAGPEDMFILFIAGHGVHDSNAEATYYYLTHEVDVENLSETAVPFEMIESLLQGIGPRNKLFLMDTCESGEVDEDYENSALDLSTNSRGLTARGLIVETTGQRQLKTVRKKKRVVRRYLFERDRYIYNDLLRRSGAIVFSSCKGGEYSYEHASIENGYFTEEIMSALLDGLADSDGDGVVSIDELRSYVTEAVARATNGLQNPTVDRDNIYLKMQFKVP
jgi:WD40 repeat protein